MRTRWGLGPVFVYEWLTASRRWQMYALRAVFVGLLFLAVAARLVQPGRFARRRGRPVRPQRPRPGRRGALLRLLRHPAVRHAARWPPGRRPGPSASTRPAARCCTCSSPTCRRARSCSASWPSGCSRCSGWCSRPCRCCRCACGWAGSTRTRCSSPTPSPPASPCSAARLAFLLSVWGRKTHEVLLAAYLFEMLLLLAYPVSIGLDAIWKRTWLSPVLRLDQPVPARLLAVPVPRGDRSDGADGFLGFCFGIGAVCALLAVVTIRPVTVRQAEPTAAAPKRRPQWSAGRGWPALDRNPVYWREWHRQRAVAVGADRLDRLRLRGGGRDRVGRLGRGDSRNSRRFGGVRQPPCKSASACCSRAWRR